MKFEFKNGNIVFIDDQGNEKGLFKHEAKQLLEELSKSLIAWDWMLTKSVTIDGHNGKKHITLKNTRDSGKSFCGAEYSQDDVTFGSLLYGDSTEGLCKECEKIYWERV